MEDLLRVTESNDVQKIIAKPTWAISVFYQDSLFEFAWCDFWKVVDEDHQQHYMSGFRTIVNGVVVRQNISLDSLENVLLRNLVKVRHVEVRQQLLNVFDFDDKYMLLGKPDVVADMIMWIYERVVSHEFVGQMSDCIYVDEVAEILGVSADDVLNVIESVLVPQKRLALNGMILWDFSAMENSRKEQAMRTGHKNLSVSDFGVWYCSVCHQSGDEWMNPKDYICFF